MPRLSICISTYNRGQFIGATLDSIVKQLLPAVEVVIVDGASPDNTPEIIAEYTARYPSIRYFREAENSGIDCDYDKAISYAAGTYCWLMTDDDVFRPGAIERVLAELDGTYKIVVANAEVRTADLSVLLSERRLPIGDDRTYHGSDTDIFFAECMRYLSFIGGLVIKRDIWISRERSKYYGSLFVHIGVICQNNLPTPIRVIADPLISIRYGNAMWTPRGFEIWMFKWPQLIWSFENFSEQSKKAVCASTPSNSSARLFYFRALGAYGPSEFAKHYASKAGWLRLTAYLISKCPEKLANSLCVLCLSAVKPSALMAQYELLQSRYATAFSRLIARCGPTG